jgi:hypothetical protein
MIAFFQWRTMYPSKVRFNPDELEEIMVGRIGHLTRELLTDETITEETKASSQIGVNFLVQNKFTDS